MPVKAACNVLIASLRKDPSHRAEQLTQLLIHDRVDLLSTNGAWANVKCRMNGTEGWVLTSQLQEITEEEFLQSPVALEFVGQSTAIQAKAYLPGRYFFSVEELPVSAKQFADIRFTEGTIREILMHYLDAPYQWGSLTAFGIDCSGLSKILYRFFGIALTNFATEQFQQGRVLDFLQDARCGDLAFFENAEGEISHVGVLLSPGDIIHASETAGRVVVDRIDQEGILSTSSGLRTHKLRLVKRLID